MEELQERAESGECLVYSVGATPSLSEEISLLRAGPRCELHVFDVAVAEFRKFFSSLQLQGQFSEVHAGSKGVTYHHNATRSTIHLHRWQVGRDPEPQRNGITLDEIQEKLGHRGRDVSLVILRSQHAWRLLSHAISTNTSVELLHSSRRLLVQISEHDMLLDGTHGGRFHDSPNPSDTFDERLLDADNDALAALHPWDVMHYTMHKLHKLGFAITYDQLAVASGTDVGSTPGQVYAFTRLAPGFFPVRQLDVQHPQPEWVQVMSIGGYILAGTLVAVAVFGSGIIPKFPRPQRGNRRLAAPGAPYKYKQ